jgi:hypothetical protein
MTEMDETPTTWKVQGNIAPLELGALTDTTPFTGSDCALTIQSETTIDGLSLKRLRVVPDW